eukprot:CAMPEP_0198118848 /NCGR_PEP_ID=MMETSP1442-20131203/23301_1 /TAXON_ID= /ORGANISM="Craspedostauros australis, Strain CCMP3328" /LENGTH=133 /DNA_ID=CAMNT_0043777181 /DNA_START=42 /DNA_END=443 /DNA_ORIENTATION=+
MRNTHHRSDNTNVITVNDSLDDIFEEHNDIDDTDVDVDDLVQNKRGLAANDSLHEILDNSDDDGDHDISPHNSGHIEPTMDDNSVSMRSQTMRSQSMRSHTAYADADMDVPQTASMPESYLRQQHQQPDIVDL